MQKGNVIKEMIFYGGEREIRTLGTCDSTHAFQACTFSRSVISPHKKFCILTKYAYELYFFKLTVNNLIQKI